MSEEANEEMVKNYYKGIPNCYCCDFAAGVYVVVGGELDGKNICPWCANGYWHAKVTINMDEK